MKLPLVLFRLGSASLLAGLAVVCAAPATAHVPVPESVLHPATAAEAWNVLRLATDNTARLLRENRLAEVPDQASLCSPALRALPQFAAASGAQKNVAAGAVQAANALNSLAQGALAGDRDFAGACLDSFRGALRGLAAAFDPATVRADVFTCPMHPGFVRTDPAALCDKCGMPLLPRRIPYSFVYTTPGAPTCRLIASTSAPLSPGHEAQVLVRLAHADGSPVVPDDLLIVHTQPIPLLIIDGALGDYHHEHPAPTATPGEYACRFTPARPGTYRVFADLVPAATGVQEYATADLSAGSPFVPQVTDKATVTDATAAGYAFQLALEPPAATALQANQPQGLSITVHDPEGQSMTALEPVMAAYAHLVGFYEDGETVVHLHPAGAEAVDSASRGGPMLTFKFYPPKAGFLRLFCQVQIKGRQVFVPFSLTVVP